MNKNIEELRKFLKELEHIGPKGGNIEFDFPDDLDRLKMDIYQELLPLFEDFEKRLDELEKYKKNILEHQEINETGGVNKIKIVLGDPNLKERR